jgi:Uma2 family endonuclease
MTASLALKQEVIYYPDTDGEPMAESDSQRKPLTYLVEALDLHFQPQSDIYVSGNLLIYYAEGDPTRSLAPDVFVAFGVPKHDRDIYRTWVEGKGPDVAIEITSRTTRRTDERVKPDLYQKLGVREYFQYDPKGHYLKPALRGRRLNADGQYEPMTSIRGIDGSVWLTSALLGLQLRLEGNRLRVFDPLRNEYLDTYSEAVTGRRQAEQQIAAERQRAEQERQRAEQERQRAEQERQRADKLASQLRALGIEPGQ